MELPLEGPGADTLEAVFDQTGISPRVAQEDLTKGTLGWHQSTAKVNPALWGQPLCDSFFPIVMASPHNQEA